MFYVEMYFRVRRACLVEGMSVREASRVFDLHRDTVRKMLDNATPQGYTRQSPPRKPKLELVGCRRPATTTMHGKSINDTDWGRPVGGGHLDDLADHQHTGGRCHANAVPLRG